MKLPNIPKSKLDKGIKHYEREKDNNKPRTFQSNSNINSYLDEERYMLNNFPGYSQPDHISDPEELEGITRWCISLTWEKVSDDYDTEPHYKMWIWSMKAFSGNKSPERRVECLTEIDGLSVVLSTAVLTFWKPTEYTLMTEPVLELLEKKGVWNGNTDPDYLQPSDYPQYLKICEDLAQSYGVSLRDLDRGLKQIASP